ncbi:DUF3311 domain-containing protein [Aneurinibacillus sp. Ricciae_BoGa-3]|uniref:DUF3311 domain-containing protein n=1 Tax=Aneurinibacillus sp. Ricciae_BoGa-3 TaxID=3022697 RepID=UPI00234179AC|nr:DUF3311 domain-containing protein [Aneurinibacillus sp. Ricciae_BoGa-3]WCK54473.1 DUF3311 domain-containing protein [Aneurinibacillus sp. Ricciae_BoGa-3]
MSNFLIVLLVAIPFLAQLVALPFVNHIQPIIIGFPFLHFWLFIWMLLTPVFTWAVYRIQKAKGDVD